MPKKVPVRLMAPFSMRCTKCQLFIYKNTKFNARKTSTGDTYLDIPIVRLSFRCSNCSNEIILSTDPKSHSYKILSGGDRNLDSHKEESIANESSSKGDINDGATASSKEGSSKASSSEEGGSKEGNPTVTKSGGLSGANDSSNAYKDDINASRVRLANSASSLSAGRIRKPLPLPKKRRNVAFDR